jgi:uncharacterized protein (TIGR00266 family)
MNHAVLHGPAFSALRLELDEGSCVLAQPGSMLAMTPGFDVDVRAGLHMASGGAGRGSGVGAFTGGVRSLFGGESFFTVVYSAKRPGQHLVLAPDHMGEILAVDVAGDDGMMVARGAFLACTPGLGFVLHNAGLQGMLATRGLFFLRTEGSGRLFINGYGGIVEEILGEGERFVVDNRHVVAFSVGMVFESVVLAASLKDSLLSGEGFVVRFTGPGRVLYQTRARPSTGMLRGLFQTLF